MPEVKVNDKAGYCRQFFLVPELSETLEGRIRKVAEDYSLADPEFKKTRLFLESINEIYMAYRDEEVVKLVMDGIGRKDERSLYNTAYGLAAICKSGIEKGSLVRKDMLREFQSVLDNYYGMAAGNIASHIQYSGLSTEDILKFCKILKCDEIVKSINKFQGIDDKTVMATGKHSADGEFFSNAICYVASKFLDKELALEAVNFIDREGSEDFKITHARELMLEYSAFVLDINSMRRLMALIDSFSEEFLINDFSEFFIGRGGQERIAKMMNNNLDSFISGETDFDVVKRFLDSKIDLPVPTRETLHNYAEVVRIFVNSKYGLELNAAQLNLFMQSELDITEEMIRLLKSGEKNVRYYTFDSCGTAKAIDYSRSELANYIFAVLYRSSDKELEAKAFGVLKELVGEATINRAKNDLMTKHRPILKEIAEVLKNPTYMRDEKVQRSLELLEATENEWILDVIRVMDYRNVHIGDAKYIKAAESRNPLDFDSSVQYACVYLPDPEESGIFAYLRDDRFMLVKYCVGDVAYGSAICYLEDNIFLVDSVEGHNAIKKSSAFEIIYSDLIERARISGAEKIVFNTESLVNITPQQFIAHIGQRGMERRGTTMRLDTDGYLEARDGLKRTGKVIGLTDLVRAE